MNCAKVSGPSDAVLSRMSRSAGVIVLSPAQLGVRSGADRGENLTRSQVSRGRLARPASIARDGSALQAVLGHLDHLGQSVGNPDAGCFEGSHLRLWGAARAGDDRAGVT